MANLNLNKVVLCGRLTADPEIKLTQSGIGVMSFSLAVNRRIATEKDGKKEYSADFINCVAWRGTAEFIRKYFNKGSSLCITGSLQTRTWEDNNKVKHYATEVVVEEAYFVDSLAKKEGTPEYVPEAYTAPQLEEVKTDDDLPF